MDQLLLVSMLENSNSTMVVFPILKIVTVQLTMLFSSLDMVLKMDKDIGLWRTNGDKNGV